MDIEYIIVQAGGKGRRMEYLTRNKPKCLVPVHNMPMLFHLFEKYPDKKFIIIGDYKFDVLKKYMSVFAKVEYLLIDSGGEKGTCAGLHQAVKNVPKEESFMIIWSDLILSEEFKFPDLSGNYVGVATDFECRWKFENGEFAEEPSMGHGVAGLFIFENRKIIEDVPASGEFVRWLHSKKILFNEYPLNKTKEYGLLSVYERLPAEICRPFNSISFEGARVVKTGINEQGRQLAENEAAWYSHMQQLKYKQIPTIYSFRPLVMERIHGKNIYKYRDASLEKKKSILKSVIDCLKELHLKESCQADCFNLKKVYIDKTIERINTVRNIIPFAEKPVIHINGKYCKNIFYNIDKLEEIILHHKPRTFSLIHGDCTFSNIMLRDDDTPVLIDPRGYFGNLQNYGDEAYDWAKLYYSVIGNYDQFNLKRFKLLIEKNEVKVEVESNGFEELESMFFSELEGIVDKKIVKLLHALIWLSLSTYAWEDYDSVCGAFYLGNYYFNDAAGLEEDYIGCFERTSLTINNSLESINKQRFELLVSETVSTLEKNNKVIVSGLGKNVPICDKFVGSMLSLGLNANFLHTNTAVHGDMGMVKAGDLVIMLTKSGATKETIYLAKLLRKRGDINLWLLTFQEKSFLTDFVGENKSLVIELGEEGDPWNIMPNNSTTINLIVLQSLVMEVAVKMNIGLDRFKMNHPGGAIGEVLKDV